MVATSYWHIHYKTGEIISLSNLIDECEGISFRYNIDNIRKTLESQNIKYVDISSVIRMFRLRQDLIFPFEILIQRILLNGNISLELSELSQYNNLRNIKKAVEDRVFNAFLDIYVDGTIE